MVRVNISSSANSDIEKELAPLSINQDMVDLVGNGTIRRLPYEHKNVWEDGTTDYTVVAEVNKTFAIVIHNTTSVLSHTSLTVSIVSSDLAITCYP